jgi:hypothetical protein
MENNLNLNLNYFSSNNNDKFKDSYGKGILDSPSGGSFSNFATNNFFLNPINIYDYENEKIRNIIKK